MRLREAVLATLIVPAAAMAQEPKSGSTQAENRVQAEIAASQTLHLQVGQSRLVEMANPIGRVSVADPDVADVKVITPKQMQISATRIGSTHISIWDKSDQVVVTDVTVSGNVSALQEQINQLFPGQRIMVSGVGDMIVLSGEVDDVRTPQRAIEVASLHSTKVANLVTVRGNQQVQLEVRFAEVSRSGLRQMGANFFYQDVGERRVGGMFSSETAPGSFIPREPRNAPPFMPGTGPGTGPFTPGVQAAPFGGSFNLFFSNTQQFPFSAILSLLSANGLAKVLAEPTLIAMSGQEAKFLAGGEIPIPIPSALGQVNVEFKKFGIQLAFTPTVLGDETIHLKLATEVSEPDPNNSISIGGISIPGFTSRQSDTTIRLKNGQSFAIAGLLSDKTRSLIKKVPLLGDIPILGALFRSTDFSREETELLVVVTARLVRPLAPHEVPRMPGEDEVNDPDDFELFLLGRSTRRWGEQEPPKRETAERGPSGEVGFGR